MDEEVKKRITLAYRKVLAPYFTEQIASGLTCNTAAELAYQMESTHQRMLRLREEDTSKLERKLRKEQDPKVVMRLFGIGSNTKEN